MMLDLLCRVGFVLEDERIIRQGLILNAQVVIYMSRWRTPLAFWEVDAPFLELWICNENLGQKWNSSEPHMPKINVYDITVRFLPFWHCSRFCPALKVLHPLHIFIVNAGINQNIDRGNWSCVFIKSNAKMKIKRFIELYPNYLLRALDVQKKCQSEDFSDDDYGWKSVVLWIKLPIRA